MTLTRPFLVCAALLTLAAPASAQMSHDAMKHDSMKHDTPKQGAVKTATPATAAFQAAAMRMHKDMAITYTGDTDVDFVRGMIPHHGAAVEMARVELQYGKDDTTRALAEAIIKAQETEIAAMEAWLKARGR